MFAMVQGGRAFPCAVRQCCYGNGGGENTGHEIGDVDCARHAAGIGISEGARVVDGVTERVGENDDDAARRIRAGAGAGHVGGEAVDGLLGAGEDSIFEDAAGEAVSAEACGHVELELPGDVAVAPHTKPGSYERDLDSHPLPYIGPDF